MTGSTDMPELSLPAPASASSTASLMSPSSTVLEQKEEDREEDEIDSEEDDVQEDQDDEENEEEEETNEEDQDDDMTRCKMFFRKLWRDFSDHHVLAAICFTLGTVAQTGFPTWRTLAVLWNISVLTTILVGTGFIAGVVATSQSHFLVYITGCLSIWFRLPHTLKIGRTHDPMYERE